jgi:uncharacterized protein (DUF305 family)
MKKYLLGISAAAIVALATGCGGGGEEASGTDTTQTPTSTSTAAEQAEPNDQDIAFVQGMIPHHQQAVDMAAMAAEKATNTQVKELASRIQGAQDSEIQQLTGMLEQWGAPAAPTTMEHGGDMSGHGMMGNEDMQQLEQATGVDFDRMWVQMMIEHHQGAVATAKTEVEQGGNADAKALAKTIAETQEAEITEMQAITL